MKNFLKSRPWLRRVFVAAISMFGIHMSALLFVGCVDDDEPGAVAIVLGNKINAPGEPHPRTAARLDRALELFRAGTVEMVLVSGGIGQEGYDEGAEMAAYLEAQGLESDKILVDSKGNNTRLTVENSKALLDAAGYDFSSANIYIVTSYFHALRCQLAFRQGRYAQISTASSNFAEWRDIYSIPRELVGFYFYLLGLR